MYEDLTTKVERELAILLGKVTHHLHPKIVNYIINANRDFKPEFQRYSNPEIRSEEFLFDGSDCIFPGVRRPINKETIGAKWKNNIYQDGTILNDNTYPRHIWSFIKSGKAYSSNSWKSTGLNAFELAHIFGHKADETHLEKKSFSQFYETKNPYSLFTSASNVVLIPKGLAKPTDKLESIKLCYYQRHIDLYGEKFYHISGFRRELLPTWYNEINWLEPILPKDWKEKIDMVLEYRSRHLRSKYGGVLHTEISTNNSKVNKQTITNTQSVIDHSATRFFVNEKIYKSLISKPRAEYILKVIPNNGKHPKGFYKIPNDLIIKYIEEKRVAYNWKKNKSFHQDGIPRDFINYFIYQ
jgi:hypothetical protein